MKFQIPNVSCIPICFLQTKKVLFAVQTNMTYDARTTQDPPLPNAVVSFEVNEFLHIKMVIFVKNSNDEIKGNCYN